jgi:hypothetical protein
MRLSQSLTIAVCISSLVCASGQTESRSALMPENAWHQISDYFANSTKPTGSWSPSKTDLDALEGRLAEISKLKSEGGIRGARILHPELSHRQYFAVVAGGKKLIFINAFQFDNDPSPLWRTQLYVIGDGGRSVWRVHYDPKTGEFSHLNTNGVG